MRYRYLACDEDRRTAKGLNGIDYIEVHGESLEEQRFLHVYFLDRPPSALADRPDLLQIEGGTRIRNINVIGAKIENYEAGISHLVVEADRAGDFSTYKLCIVREKLPLDLAKNLDPLYSECNFSFKQGCSSEFDCKLDQTCPDESRPEPLIDYMAKDYASFRQALLDLIPRIMPDWEERHEADVGMAVLEVLAYAADHLSYYQDAVANEAYLETACQRISVRRHARLIDYQMHEGASARVFVHFEVNKNLILPVTLPAETQLLTCIDEPLETDAGRPGTAIPKYLERVAIEASDAVYETMHNAQLHHLLNEIPIHTWGDEQCCLLRGATEADLSGDRIQDPENPLLKSGDFLLFEEVVSPETGLVEDADPEHRQIVRLISVVKRSDPMSNPPSAVTRVTWDWEDRLKFPLCISAIGKDGTLIPSVSVARGNIILADHGQRIRETHPALAASTGQRSHRIRLKEGPLSYRLKTSDGDSVSQIQKTDPGKAEPQILRLKFRDCTEPWTPAIPDLLSCGPFDPRFAVETDNDGFAWLRFGDGVYGKKPPEVGQRGSDKSDDENNGKSNGDNSDISIDYRVGVGRIGNVGRDSLKHIIEPEDGWVRTEDGSWKIVSLRNPIPAWGGEDPEPLERVRKIAPAAFHLKPQRAVTEEDYGLIAERHPKVSKAVASFRWTGSWHTVFITVDPRSETEVKKELKEKLKDYIAKFAQAGYDIEIDGPTFVPLEIEADICVVPGYFRGDVKAALLQALSSRMLPDGRMGFFHPDKFTFGQPVYLSALYAVMEAVDGVDSVAVKVFQRRERPSDGLRSGRLPMGRLEIARLDNDPDFPENGIIKMNMIGGR